MTWSLSAAGHHSSSDWQDEEYQILEAAIKVVEVEDTVVSSFSFNGNHVSAISLDDARAKVASYREASINATEETAVEEEDPEEE